MQIKINGFKWDILWVKKTHKKLFCSDEQCLGVTYYDEYRIYIDKSLSKKLFEETVIHELTHAFLYCYDVDFEDVESISETICGFTEKHLKKILKLTKKVVKIWKTEMAIKLLA